MAPEDNPADDVQPTREEWEQHERERQEITERLAAEAGIRIVKEQTEARRWMIEVNKSDAHRVFVFMPSNAVVYLACGRLLNAFDAERGSVILHAAAQINAGPVQPIIIVTVSKAALSDRDFRILTRLLGGGQPATSDIVVYGNPTECDFAEAFLHAIVDPAASLTRPGPADPTHN